MSEAFHATVQEDPLKTSVLKSLLGAAQDMVRDGEITLTGKKTIDSRLNISELGLGSLERASLTERMRERLTADGIALTSHVTENVAYAIQDALSNDGWSIEKTSDHIAGEISRAMTK